MPYQISVVDPRGGLDTDSDLAKVREGDYTTALNIQHLSEKGQTSFTIQTTRGNKLRFAIADTVIQNKTYRITLTNVDSTPHAGFFYRANGSEIATYFFTDGSTYDISASNAQTAFNTVLAAATPVQTVTYQHTSGSPYLYITLTTATGMEWSFVDSTLFPTVTAEAIDGSIAGQANIIDSYDLLGELFIWSTAQKYLPTVIENKILTLADNGSGLIRVGTVGAHGLITGQSIIITVDGAAAASTNGAWIVNVIDTLHFDLLTSSFVSGSFTTGSLTINAEGIGEIGVAVYDGNTDTTTYTRLVRSKAFNFRRPKQIASYCEKNNFQDSLYWTDDYNIPRVLYYTGAYVTDGAIDFVNAKGEYEYDSIADETKLILSNDSIGVLFNQQYTGGGAVKSGNWRYAFRLVTANFNTTNWTELTNPVNVYLANQAGAPNLICGDLSLVQTSKQNEFRLSNLPVNVFAYVEMAGVNYVDTAIVGSIIKRVPYNTSTLLIVHTGTEADVVDLDVATLNQFSFDIETAKNIDAIDNRLILTNLTTAQLIDFSAFSQTFKHTLLQKNLQSIGIASTGNKFGEYQDPVNVFNNVGYCIYDTYRFEVRYKLKATGNLTGSFWVDDIRFDDSATNITGNRRLAGLPNLFLTDTGTNPNVYVPYVQFSNINLDYLVNGIPIRDLVSEIHFERVERIPEVLTTGMLVMVVGGSTDATGSGLDISFYGDNSHPSTQFGDIPFISGFNGVAPVFPRDFSNTHGKVSKLLAPDIFYGKTSIAAQAGDKVYVVGTPEIQTTINIINSGRNSDYTEYNGYLPLAQPIGVGDVLSSQVITDGNGGISIGGIEYINALTSVSGLINQVWANKGGIVINTTQNLVDNTTNVDAGFYYTTYFREITYTDPDNNKYGDRTLSKSIPTGAILKVDSTVISPTSQDVFGGDVFTQKTYLRNRDQATPNTNFLSAGGVGFYSQNVVNSQMGVKTTTDEWAFPTVSADSFLNGSYYTLPIAPYDQGYSIINGISSDAAFDPNLPNQSDLPTQIRWSDLKPQNSVVDNFRIFLPLNFKDLPLTWGEITHHANFNGELFTWQPRMVQRQYFNTRGTMNVTGGADTQVLIGDGSVLSRDGQMVTAIGTYHKWSVIKGKSTQGNDVMYWINTELKQAMRMGYDGTIRIGNIYGMQSFLANNLKWVVGKDTPADGQGICGVTDDRYLATIWTIMGKRNIAAWNFEVDYPINTVVSYTPSVFSTFEQTGEFYVSAIANNAGQQPDTHPTKWILIPHALGSVVVNGITYYSNDYYNEYTIEFNEQKNKFTTYYTFKPKIYLKWTDTFLTPRPISNTGTVYEHRLGDFCVWYNDGSTSQTEDGYIELLFNKDESLIKQFFAILVNSEIVPVRIDFLTDKQQTFAVDADFEQMIDFWMSSIKNDILTSTTGLANDQDTSRSFGQWIKIKITFQASVFQKVVDVVVKFMASSRPYTK